MTTSHSANNARHVAVLEQLRSVTNPALDPVAADLQSAIDAALCALRLGDLVAKWRAEAAGKTFTAYEEGRVAEKLRCARELEAALLAALSGSPTQ